MTVELASPTLRVNRPEPSRPGVVVGALVGAGVVGLLAALTGPMAVVIAVVGAIFGLVAWRPVVATYLYLATLPFLAGLNRGTGVPMLRPNEALLVLLVAGAATGGYIRLLRGASPQVRITRFDIALAAFVVLSTAWPIASLLLRGTLPSGSEIAAVLPVCKLAGLLVLARATVRTEAQVRWCIRLIVAGAVVLAVIAVLQTVSFMPMLRMLEMWWPTAPDRIDARGTTTLNNAIATGDYLLIGLVLLAVSAVRGLIGRRELAVCGLVLMAGVLAAGQFSTWLGVAVVGALILRSMPAVRARAIRWAPLLALPVVLGAPAFLGRLQEVADGSMPQSWLVRWDNVANLYLPQLMSHGHWLVGVSPDSVLIPPDTWREVVYLESGYLQFLWVGGVPLLIGFAVLSVAVLKVAGRAGSRADAVGACASAVVIVWWTEIVVSVFDAHLTMRGPGDVIFILLGIILSGNTIGGRNDVGD